MSRFSKKALVKYLINAFKIKLIILGGIMLINCDSTNILIEDIRKLAKEQNIQKIGSTDITYIFERYLKKEMPIDDVKHFASKYEFVLLNTTIPHPKFIENHPEFQGLELMVYENVLENSFSSNHSIVVHLGIKNGKLHEFKAFYSIVWKLP